MSNYSKTTVEIDDEKLSAIMRLTGSKTRKEALDWALTEARRIATLNNIIAEPWTAEFLNDAVDPNYDVLEARRSPANYRKRK